VRDRTGCFLRGNVAECRWSAVYPSSYREQWIHQCRIMEGARDGVVWPR